MNTRNMNKAVGNHNKNRRKESRNSQPAKLYEAAPPAGNRSHRQRHNGVHAHAAHRLRGPVPPLSSRALWSTTPATANGFLAGKQGAYALTQPEREPLLLLLLHRHERAVVPHLGLGRGGGRHVVGHGEGRAAREAGVVGVRGPQARVVAAVRPAGAGCGSGTYGGRRARRLRTRRSDRRRRFGVVGGGVLALEPCPPPGCAAGAEAGQHGLGRPGRHLQ